MAILNRVQPPVHNYKISFWIKLRGIEGDIWSGPNFKDLNDQIIRIYQAQLPGILKYTLGYDHDFVANIYAVQSTTHRNRYVWNVYIQTETPFTEDQYEIIDVLADPDSDGNHPIRDSDGFECIIIPTNPSVEYFPPGIVQPW